MNINNRAREILENIDLLSAYVPILAYHHVIKDNCINNISNISVSQNQFDRQMRFLYEYGYKCLDLNEIFYNFPQESFREKKAFVLTFDDGFDDFYTIAYPVLRNYGFTATVFLVTDLLGGCSKWEGEDGARMLTWDQINNLSTNGISFGSHSCTHPSLLRISDEQIRYELSASKECIEKELHKKISFFTYPFGESNQKIQQMVNDAGYQGALGVITGKPSRYNRWRSECGAQDTLQTFNFKLSWTYLFFQKLRGWLREETMLGRVLRKIKYYNFSYPSASIW